MRADICSWPSAYGLHLPSDHAALASLKQSFPVAFNEQDLEKAMEPLAIGEQASLHGRTANGEVCRCLPGSLLPGKPQSELKAEVIQELNASRLGTKQTFHDLSGEAARLTEPYLERLQTETQGYDQMLKAFRAKVGTLEKAAADLQDSFQKVRAAHGEGNCAWVTESAKEHGEAPPQCDVDWKQAINSFTECRLKAQPRCKLGAASLDAIKEYSLLPPELEGMLSAWQDRDPLWNEHINNSQRGKASHGSIHSFL